MPPLRVAASSIQKLTNWLIEVANAAPDTPMLSVNINNGSSATFSNAPDPIPIMAKKALPCSLS